MHFRVTGEWNGEPFNRVIEAEDINDCYATTAMTTG